MSKLEKTWNISALYDSYEKERETSVLDMIFSPAAFGIHNVEMILCCDAPFEICEVHFHESYFPRRIAQGMFPAGKSSHSIFSQKMDLRWKKSKHILSNSGLMVMNPMGSNP